MRGSGGHRTIFNHANALCRAGYDCSVHIDVSDLSLRLRDPAALAAFIEEAFGPCDAALHLGFDVSEQVDLVVATAWPTAFHAAKLRASGQAKFAAYFIQDDESRFFAAGEQNLIARSTYQLDLTPIVLGHWLAHEMENISGRPVWRLPFTADLATYARRSDNEGSKVPKTDARHEAIAFFCQPQKPRRATQIASLALKLVKQKRPNLQIYSFGADQPPPFELETNHLGVLSICELGDLYRKCAVGLSLSATNPSRTAFEMMSAGLPIVELYGDNTRYDFPEAGCLLADPTPWSLAAAIERLLEDDALRADMSDGARTAMQSRPITLETSETVDAVTAIISGRTPTHGSSQAVYHRAPVKRPPSTEETTLCADTLLTRRSPPRTGIRGALGRIPLARMLVREIRLLVRGE